MIYALCLKLLIPSAILRLFQARENVEFARGVVKGGETQTVQDALDGRFEQRCASGNENDNLLDAAPQETRDNDAQIVLFLALARRLVVDLDADGGRRDEIRRHEKGDEDPFDSRTAEPPDDEHGESGAHEIAENADDCQVWLACMAPGRRVQGSRYVPTHRGIQRRVILIRA